ncbi:MAG: hypothetical protein ACMXYF_04260, partial [Candidatus Woesearchaeota archaeon]
MKWTILQLFGWLFLLLSISTIYFALTVTSVDNLFWLSNWALALIGIGLIFKLPRLIASQLNIILIPHLFWTIDFVYILLFRQPLWGITDYFFETTHLLLNIASLSHVLLYPVGLYALFVYGLQSTDFW